MYHNIFLSLSSPGLLRYLLKTGADSHRSIRFVWV